MLRHSRWLSRCCVTPTFRLLSALPPTRRSLATTASMPASPLPSLGLLVLHKFHNGTKDYFSGCDFEWHTVAATLHRRSAPATCMVGWPIQRTPRYGLVRRAVASLSLGGAEALLHPDTERLQAGVLGLLGAGGCGSGANAAVGPTTVVEVMAQVRRCTEPRFPLREPEAWRASMPTVEHRQQVGIGAGASGRVEAFRRQGLSISACGSWAARVVAPQGRGLWICGVPKLGVHWATLRRWQRERKARPGALWITWLPARPASASR